MKIAAIFSLLGAATGLRTNMRHRNTPLGVQPDLRDMKEMDPKKLARNDADMYKKAREVSPSKSFDQWGHLLPDDLKPIIAAQIDAKSSPSGSTASTPAPTNIDYSGLDAVFDKLNAMWLDLWTEYDETLIECTQTIEDLRFEWYMLYLDKKHTESDLDEDIAHMAEWQVALETATKEKEELEESLKIHRSSCAREVATVEHLFTFLRPDATTLKTIIDNSSCKQTDPFKAPGEPKDKVTATSRNAWLTSNQKALLEEKSSLQESVQAVMSSLSTEMQGLLGRRDLSEKARKYLKDQEGMVLLQCWNKHPMGESFIELKTPKEAAALLQLPGTGVTNADGSADVSETKCTHPSPLCPLFNDALNDLLGEINDNIYYYETYLSAVKTNCTRIETDIKANIAEWEHTIGIAEGHIVDLNSRIQRLTALKATIEADFMSKFWEFVQTFTTCEKELKGHDDKQCSLPGLQDMLLTLNNAPDDMENCKVSGWTWGDCPKKCDPTGASIRELKRYVEVSSNSKGLPCPPLSAKVVCNKIECPIDCVMGDWSDWTRCSTDCDVGTKYRVRDVTEEKRWGGEECGMRQESALCNQNACDKECVLGEWTQWSECETQCGPGTKERFRHIDEQAVGDGFCPSHFDERRFNRVDCGNDPCEFQEPVCESMLDIVFVFDASGSVGSTNWKKSIDFFKDVVGRFELGENKVKVGAVQFATKAEKRAYLTADKDALIGDNSNSVYKKMYSNYWGGATATGPGLYEAETIISSNGNRAEADTVVVLVTDGGANYGGSNGMSAVEVARQASVEIKKNGRLVVVAIGSQSKSVFDNMKQWSSGGVNDFFKVQDFDELAAGINDAVVSVCKKVKEGAKTTKGSALLSVSERKAMYNKSEGFVRAGGKLSNGHHQSTSAYIAHQLYSGGSINFNNF